jgi:hypothetical protein
MNREQNEIQKSNSNARDLLCTSGSLNHVAV